MPPANPVKFTLLFSGLYSCSFSIVTVSLCTVLLPFFGLHHCQSEDCIVVRLFFILWTVIINLWITVLFILGQCHCQYLENATFSFWTVSPTFFWLCYCKSLDSCAVSLRRVLPSVSGQSVLLNRVTITLWTVLLSVAGQCYHQSLDSATIRL